jgi:hypothetical protein
MVQEADCKILTVFLDPDNGLSGNVFVWETTLR